MERLFTCFVSSTFLDLKDQRQRVVDVLLRNECVPFGMEFFPSAGETQWEIIVNSIEHADFCVFVIAGRYGSISDEPPLSWTHREFREAKRLKKPIAVVLHATPGTLPADNCEAEQVGRDALAGFRDELQGATICSYYRDDAELVAAVASSVGYMQRSGKLTGWVRAQHAVSPSAPTSVDRGAKLSVSVEGATESQPTRVIAETRPAWPIDLERVIANAMHDARRETEGLADERTAAEV